MINIIISHTNNVVYNKQFYECDDFLTADGDNIANSNNNMDGITNFNLSSVISDVKALFPTNLQTNLDVLIFEPHHHIFGWFSVSNYGMAVFSS